MIIAVASWHTFSMFIPDETIVAIAVWFKVQRALDYSVVVASGAAETCRLVDFVFATMMVRIFMAFRYWNTTSMDVSDVSIDTIAVGLVFIGTLDELVVLTVGAVKSSRFQDFVGSALVVWISIAVFLRHAVAVLVPDVVLLAVAVRLVPQTAAFDGGAVADSAVETLLLELFVFAALFRTFFVAVFLGNALAIGGPDETVSAVASRFVHERAPVVPEVDAGGAVVAPLLPDFVWSALVLFLVVFAGIDRNALVVVISDETIPTITSSSFVQRTFDSLVVGAGGAVVAGALEDLVGTTSSGNVVRTCFVRHALVVSVPDETVLAVAGVSGDERALLVLVVLAVGAVVARVLEDLVVSASFGSVIFTFPLGDTFAMIIPHESFLAIAPRFLDQWAFLEPIVVAGGAVVS